MTVSARADIIESLAGQEFEILNVGPEPERTTVTRCEIGEKKVSVYSVKPAK